MRYYIGLIHKDSDSDFGISFPDFPGCVSAGATLDEVRMMGEEALSFHIEGMREDGSPIPEPTSLEAIMAEAANRDAVVTLVPATAFAPKAVRVNITIPEDTLAEIDRFAARNGLNRSGFLVHAARDAMSVDRPARKKRMRRSAA